MNVDRGWYAVDPHVRGYHSSPNGPGWEQVVQYARAAGLDAIAIAEIGTDEHWRELGPVQADASDLLLWPAREIASWAGRAVVLGETPSTVAYRVGPLGEGFAQIQADVTADGALFAVSQPAAAPTLAGVPCAGCSFTAWSELDLDRVHLVEVVTGSAQLEQLAGTIADPDVGPSIAAWESLLQQGHRAVAIGGSDDGVGTRYGVSRTQVLADGLGVAPLRAALLAGHAYVQGVGSVSPTADLTVTTPSGVTATFGDTVVEPTAELALTLRGALGQVLVIRRNGVDLEQVVIDADPFVYGVSAVRVEGEGPLGTFYGFEVRATTGPDSVRTLVANPVFLADQPPPDPPAPPSTIAVPAPDLAPEDAASPDALGSPTLDAPGGGSDGGGAAPALVGMAVGVVIVGMAWVWGGRRRPVSGP